jgi:hypothetical protein
MRTVHKYQFPIQDEFKLWLYGYVQVVHVGLQDDIPTMWTEIDSTGEAREHSFRVFGTGHKIPDDLRGHHVGTFMQAQFVWHLYHVGAIT